MQLMRAGGIVAPSAQMLGHQAFQRRPVQLGSRVQGSSRAICTKYAGIEEIKLWMSREFALGALIASTKHGIHRSAELAALAVRTYLWPVRGSCNAI
jgi:hypothetical protein